jgi:hypothetical protein
MSTRKTIRVPLAADGIPVIVDRQKLDRTSEIPVGVPASERDRDEPPSTQGAPCQALNDEVTVPVHSSIESSLTFEVLRRQSTEDGSDEEPKP